MARLSRRDERCLREKIKSNMGNNKKFIACGLLTWTIYLAFYLVEPARKFINDPRLTLYDANIFALIVCFLGLSLFFYFLKFELLKKGGVDKKTVIFFILLFNITLLFVWPVGSHDTFSYISQGRVLSAHHSNPYLSPYDNFSDDSFYDLIRNRWSKNTTVYGPLFTIISAILTFIGGNNLILSLFLFKLLFTAANLLSGYLIWKIFKSIKGLYLYSFNPLILYEFLLNGHNDALVILLLLLCFYFLFKEKYVYSVFFLLLSALIKYMTLIFLPVFLLAICLRLGSFKGKIKFLSASAAVLFLSAIIFYLPFGGGWRATLWTISYSTSIHDKGILSVPLFISPVMFSSIAALRYLNVNDYLRRGILGGKIIFIISYLILLARIFLKRSRPENKDIIKYFLISLSLFYLIFLTWLMPWYFTVLILLLICYSAALDDFKYNKYIYGITLFCILHYFILR